jgi:hypothetical protein
VLNTWYRSFGGNGVTLSAPVWEVAADGRHATLQIDAIFELRHGGDGGRETLSWRIDENGVGTNRSGR